MGLFSRKKGVGELRESGDVEGLLELAEKARKPEDRAEALEAIGALGPGVAETLAAQAKRNAAAEALGSMGADVAMPIAQRLIGEGGEARLRGYKIVAATDLPAAAEALAAGIRSDSDSDDAITATATNWKRTDGVIAEALFAVAQEAMASSEAAYDSAISTLGARVVAADGDGGGALAVILDKLRSDDAKQRMLAAEILRVGYDREGADGPEDAETDPRTADVLAAACEDPEALVRQAAGAALGLQGDRRATPAICELLRSGDEERVRVALDVLKVLRDPAALEALQPLYDDANGHGLGIKTAALVGRRHGQLKEAAKAGQAG